MLNSFRIPIAKSTIISVSQQFNFYFLFLKKVGVKMVRNQKFLAILCSILIILNALPVYAASVHDFSDMPQQNHWARKALEAAVENGLLKGSVGRLNPQNNLTRAEMAAIINRAFGATAQADISSFSDVSVNSWQYAEMAKAIEMETFYGDNTGKLRPDAPITRQEAFAVLARSLRLSGGSAGALDKFSDKNKIAGWAADAIAALAEAGYVNGSGGKLNPTDYITREQFAQIMYNAISGYIPAAGTYTEDITGNVMVKTPGVILKDMTINGDLIIGEGLADGGLILENVKVTGRILIRGGGSTDGIKIEGTSSAAEIIIYDKTGVALNVSDESVIGKVSVSTNNAVLNIPATTLVIDRNVNGTNLNGKAVTGGQTIDVDGSGNTDNSGDVPGGNSGENNPGGNTGGNTGGGNTGGGDPGGSDPGTPTIATESVALNPMAVNVVLGSYCTITAARTPANANDVITWSSSDESVAKVDATGKVGAVGVGTAVISATAVNGFVASATVYVTAPASGSSFTISVPGTVVPAGSMYNEVTIAEGVGENEVKLTGVIMNRLITKGGGSNSIHLNGVSILSISIEETPAEGTRILLSESATVGTINITNPNANAIVETEIGSGSSVGSIISVGVLTVRNLSVSSIDASADVKLEGSAVGEITANGESVITLDSTSVIDKLKAQTPTTVRPAAGATANRIDNVQASSTLTLGVPVNTIEASTGAVISSDSPVGSVTGNADSITLTASADDIAFISANADTVWIKDGRGAVTAGNVREVNVVASANGTASTVISGTISAVNITGSGKIGSVTIENGSPAVNVTAGVTGGTVTVTGTAAPTISGAGAVDVVNTTGNNITINLTNNNAKTTENTTVTLQYIAVTSYPSKLTYTPEATELDRTGMVVTGYYSVGGFDGLVTKTLAYNTDYTLSAWDNTAGTHIVTVTSTSGGKTATFPVNVVAKTVSTISIQTLPTKLTYEMNEDLELAGGKIFVTYTDSVLYPGEAILMTDAGSVTVTGFDSTTVGTKALTVTYGGKECKFSIVVKDTIGEQLKLAKAEAKVTLLEYYAELLGVATYSSTGKDRMTAAKNAGLTGIEAATTTGNGSSTTDVQYALNAAKTALDNIQTQDEEWTAEANNFKNVTYATVLAKTIETIAISDKAAVAGAISAYAALNDGVKAKLTNQKTLLDSLLAKINTLETAQTLEAAKTAATGNVNSAFGRYASGYTANYSAIEAAKNTGLVNINAATTVSAVISAQDAAISAMAAFKSDAALLADAKLEAIAELALYLPTGRSLSDYNSTGKVQISEARMEGSAAINAASTIEAVSTALAGGKQAINAVKTTAQMAAEVLDAAKQSAIVQLNAFGNINDYRAAQQAEFDAAKAAGTAAINNATNVDGVNTALANAKAAIKAIKTNAQLTAEELAAAKAAAKNEINSYLPDGRTNASYSAAGLALIAAQRSKWCSYVDASSTVAAVNATIAEAKAEIDQVDTLEDEINNQLNAAANAVKGANYGTEIAQTDYDTEAKVKEYLISKAKTAIADSSITVTVSGNYTAPVAGTLIDPDGTDGSYVFTITLTKGGQSKTVDKNSQEAEFIIIITAAVYNAQPSVIVSAETNTVEYGADLTLTAEIHDILQPEYQWYSNTENSTDGAAVINGATGSTYKPLTTTAGTMYYYCVVNGTITSNIVRVTVEGISVDSFEEFKAALADDSISTFSINGDITIEPDTETGDYEYIINKDITVSEGAILTIAAGARLILDREGTSLTNKGTILINGANETVKIYGELEIGEEAILINEGTLTNEGSLMIFGTLDTTNGDATNNGEYVKASVGTLLGTITDLENGRHSVGYWVTSQDEWDVAVSDEYVYSIVVAPGDTHEAIHVVGSVSPTVINSNFFVNEGATLIVDEGAALILNMRFDGVKEVSINNIDGELINDGTITLNVGLNIKPTGSLTNNGTINLGDNANQPERGGINMRGGLLMNNGTINNYGWIEIADEKFGSDPSNWIESIMINEGSINGYTDKDREINDIQFVTLTDSEAGLINAATSVKNYDKIAIIWDGSRENPNSTITLTQNIEVGNLYIDRYKDDSNTVMRMELIVGEGKTLRVKGNLDIAGKLTNKGTIELQGYNEQDDSEGHMNVRENGILQNDSTGQITNYGVVFVEIGSSFNNSGKFINNGRFSGTSKFYGEAGEPLAYSGKAPEPESESKEFNFTAIVTNEAGLRAAAKNEFVTDILVEAETDGVDFSKLTPEQIEELMTIDITGTEPLVINAALSITAYIDCEKDANGNELIDENGDPIVDALYPSILNITSGAVLTLNSYTNVVGDLRVASGGTLNIRENSYVEIRKTTVFGIDRDGKLKNEGTIVNNGFIMAFGIIEGNGTIVGSGAVEKGAIIDTEKKLKTALENDYYQTIIINDKIELTDDLDINRKVIIEEGWNDSGDLRNAIIVPEGITLTVSDELEVKGGLIVGGTLNVGTDGNINISNGGEVIIEGNVTNDGNIRIMEGRFHADGNFVMNNGEIEELGGWVDIPNENDIKGNPIRRYAKRVDIGRALYDELNSFGFIDPEQSDVDYYASIYADWNDLSFINEAGEKEWNYEDVRAMAWLIKNGIIQGTQDNRINPYKFISRAEAAQILYNMLGKGEIPEALPQDNDNISFNDVTQDDWYFTAVMHLAGAGVVYGDEDGNFYPDGLICSTWYEWGNELRIIVDRFIDKLGVNRVEAASEEELTAALEKTYVSEIIITADIAITGDVTIGGDDRSVRVIISGKDSGATLTVADGARLTISDGSELQLDGRLINNGEIYAFGGIRTPEGSDWNNHFSGNRINSFTDVIGFAENLVNAISAYGLEAPSETEINDCAEKENWPDWDFRISQFAMAVKYGGIQPITDEHDPNRIRWEPYKRVTYGEAMNILDGFWKAINGPESTMPEDVRLDGFDDEQPLNDATDDMNRLIDSFVSALGPIVDDKTTELTIIRDNNNPDNDYQPRIRNVRFANTITVNCDGSHLVNDDNGGRIEFENCIFEDGLIIELGDNLWFDVDLTDSCTVAGEIDVRAAQGASPSRFNNNERVQLSGVPNDAVVNSTVCLSVSSGTPGGRFTLSTGNSAVEVQGLTQENGFEKDDRFQADLQWKCVAEHNGDFNSFDHDTDCDNERQFPELFFGGKVDTVYASGASEFMGFSLFEGNETDVTLRLGDRNAAATVPTWISGSLANGKLTVISNDGTVINGDVEVVGIIDIREMNVSEGYRTYVNTDRREYRIWNNETGHEDVYDGRTEVTAGSRAVYTNGGGDNGNTTVILAQGGSLIYSAPWHEVNLIYEGGPIDDRLDIGRPHVFGEGDGAGIYIGTGDISSLSFKVEQGIWNEIEQGCTEYVELDYKVDGPFEDEGNGKVHLVKEEGKGWITDPYQIKLTVQWDYDSNNDTAPISVKYERIERKEEFARRSDLAKALYNEFSKEAYGLDLPNEDAILNGVFDAKLMMGDQAEEGATLKFTDWPGADDFASSQALALLLSNRIITGTESPMPDTESGNYTSVISPYSDITRAQAAMLLFRLLGKGNIPQSLAEINPDISFADVDSNQWFYNPVMTLAKAGVIDGWDGRFWPDENLKGNEVYPLVERFVSALGPVAIDGDVWFTVSEKNEPIRNKIFNGKVTVTGSDEWSDSWNPDIRFESCTFNSGLNVLLGSMSYNVNLRGCNFEQDSSRDRC